MASALTVKMVLQYDITQRGATEERAAYWKPSSLGGHWNAARVMPATRIKTETMIIMTGLSCQERCYIW